MTWRGSGLPTSGTEGTPLARRWAVPLVFVVLLGAFAGGIWASYREAFPARGLYRVTGVYEGRAGDTMILVRHDAVRGLMDEMTSMVLVAESPELLDRAALRPGDRLRFTLRQLPDKLLIVDLRKIQ